MNVPDELEKGTINVFNELRKFRLIVHWFFASLIKKLAELN